MQAEWLIQYIGPPDNGNFFLNPSYQSIKGSDVYYSVYMDIPPLDQIRKDAEAGVQSKGMIPVPAQGVYEALDLIEKGIILLSQDESTEEAAAADIGVKLLPPVKGDGPTNSKPAPHRVFTSPNHQKGSTEEA